MSFSIKVAQGSSADYSKNNVYSPNENPLRCCHFKIEINRLQGEPPSFIILQRDKIAKLPFQIV